MDGAAGNSHHKRILVSEFFRRLTESATQQVEEGKETRLYKLQRDKTLLVARPTIHEIQLD